jgi:hypothetical protein
MIRSSLVITLLVISLRCSAAETAQQKALDYLVEHRQRFHQDLINLTAIPSVSALPARAQDVLRAAEWLKARLKIAGLEVGDCHRRRGLKVNAVFI